jgi:hypothetical protein
MLLETLKATAFAKRLISAGHFELNFSRAVKALFLKKIIQPFFSNICQKSLDC